MRSTGDYTAEIRRSVAAQAETCNPEDHRHGDWQPAKIPTPTGEWSMAIRSATGSPA